MKPYWTGLTNGKQPAWKVFLSKEVVNLHSSPTGACSSISLHTSTCLCQAATTPLYRLIIPANTCPASAALKASRFSQPWHRETSKAFPNQLYGLSLSLRKAWRCPTQHSECQAQPRTFPCCQRWAQQRPWRVQERAVGVTLLGMLSAQQGQPWQPGATSRSTQQQLFPNRLLQQLRLEPVSKGGVVGQDPPEPPSKHHFFTYKYFH